MVEHGWEVYNCTLRRWSRPLDILSSRAHPAVDIVPPAASEAGVKARYIAVDLKDYGQVVSCMTDVDSGWKGVEAIIHLSAIPAPGRAVSRDTLFAVMSPYHCNIWLVSLAHPQANHVVFHTNILQTYNILESCRVSGIKNIALASSETVFGIPLHPTPPTKFPIGEEVERPESSYSLSKLMGEKMSQQFTR